MNILRKIKHWYWSLWATPAMRSEYELLIRGFGQRHLNKIKKTDHEIHT